MATTPGTLQQAAAIPIRLGQVCLITSRNGKRWVVPKGCLEPGKTAGEIRCLDNQVEGVASATLRYSAARRSRNQRSAGL